MLLSSWVLFLLLKQMFHVLFFKLIYLFTSQMMSRPNPMCLEPQSSLWMLGESDSESCQASRLVDSIDLPVEFPSPQGLQSFRQLFHKCLWPPSNLMLWIAASVSVICRVESLRGQLYKAVVCKRNRTGLPSLASVRENASALEETWCATGKQGVHALRGEGEEK